MEEIWKDVVGYEGYYEVSNLGNVRSVDREIVKSDGVVQPRRARAMAKSLNTDGYLTVKLSKDGKSERIAVHRLVALAFIPNPNRLSDVNHIDFDRTNSRVDNLEWISHKENVHYTIDAGRHHCNRDLFGENNPNYGNTTLRDYYASHPEEKQKLARKGSQNGRAKPTSVVFADWSCMTFSYLRECARYLIDNRICRAKTLNVVADNITKAIKNDSAYCNCHFSRA